MSTENFGFSKAAPLAASLNSQYDYLRVEVDGYPPALLVLGYVDAHPQGAIEVWYSAQKEVIKIQNGRIVGTTGLKLDWRTVRYPFAPPAWADAVTQASVYLRIRDEMPGYRYAISDRIELMPWTGLPPISLPISLPVKQAGELRWFREQVQSAAQQPLPPAWFAWGQHRGKAMVVYSEQCLSPSFCLKLQRWPVQEKVL